MRQEDIEQMIQQKSQLRARPVNLGATRAYLLQLRDAAEDKGDHDEVRRVDAELTKLTSLDSRGAEEGQKKVKIGDINKRNKACILHLHEQRLPQLTI